MRQHRTRLRFPIKSMNVERKSPRTVIDWCTWMSCVRRCSMRRMAPKLIRRPRNLRKFDNGNDDRDQHRSLWLIFRVSNDCSGGNALQVETPIGRRTIRTERFASWVRRMCYQRSINISSMMMATSHQHIRQLRISTGNRSTLFPQYRHQRNKRINEVVP